MLVTKTMAGAIPCERLRTWHICMKSIFDQSGAGRVLEALKNNQARQLTSWRRYLGNIFPRLIYSVGKRSLKSGCSTIRRL